MANVLSSGIGHDGVRQHHIEIGMLLKVIVDRLQGSWEILLVAVQIGQDFSLRATVAPIYRVVHSVVFFDECLDTFILWEPLAGTVIRAGILHDMFERQPLLIGD